MPTLSELESLASLGKSFQSEIVAGKMRTDMRSLMLAMIGG